MMSYGKILIFIFAAFLAACAGSPKLLTPFETLQTYSAAVKKKDTAAMKRLLSDSTLKMHEKAAKDQGITLDEIVQRETLISPDQKRAEYRNETIEGDRASIEVKNSYGIWDKVEFVKEDGVWKIDKQAFVNPILEKNEQDNQRLDEIINQGKQP